MVVNVYLDNKGNILNTLVDETTSHRLGDIIAFKGDDIQKVVTEVKTQECYDYSVIVHVNRLEDHDNSVDDVAVLVLEVNSEDG